jgi:hypothetical protein
LATLPLNVVLELGIQIILRNVDGLPAGLCENGLGAERHPQKRCGSAKSAGGTRHGSN